MYLIGFLFIHFHKLWNPFHFGNPMIALLHVVTTVTMISLHCSHFPWYHMSLNGCADSCPFYTIYCYQLEILCFPLDAARWRIIFNQASSHLAGGNGSIQGWIFHHRNWPRLLPYQKCRLWVAKEAFKDVLFRQQQLIFRVLPPGIQMAYEFIQCMSTL